jgi:hypothetical protein
MRGGTPYFLICLALLLLAAVPAVAAPIAQTPTEKEGKGPPEKPPVTDAGK